MKLMSIFIALAMVSMLLAGCGKYAEDGQTIGQKLDRALDRTNSAIIEAGDKLGSNVEFANDTVAKVTSSISDQALLTTLAVSDAATTSSIKTDLVRDPDLKALRIDVETRHGVVALNGLANDEEGRTRAERIARATKGVVSVNNYLTVKRL